MSRHRLKTGELIKLAGKSFPLPYMFKLGAADGYLNLAWANSAVEPHSGYVP